MPGESMRLGQPDGSAVPLVWAHAEYLKLLRSAADGKVFDRVDPVYERYCEPEGRAKLRRDLEIYSRRRPIQTMAPGSTLRILDDKQFRAGLDHRRLADHQDQLSRSLGSAGFSADIPPDGAKPCNGRCIGRNRTPGLDTMLKSRLMPIEQFPWVQNALQRKEKSQVRYDSRPHRYLSRYTFRRYIAPACRRHRGEGQERPPRRSPGLRAHRVPAVSQADEAQSGALQVGQPGPLRPFERPCIGDALFHAVSFRLRRHAG